MKAYGYEQFGGPDVFQQIEMPTPEVTKPDDVLIKTLAVGLNNFERSQRAGNFGRGRLPIVPGRDVVGEVIEIGTDVTTVKVGDIVMGHGGPAYAEYVLLPAEQVVLKPTNASLAEAVALVTPGITAYNAVTEFANVMASDRVFVNGATGGVGAIAAQVAKHLGAYVIGTGSSTNQDALTQLKLDEIGLYDQENLNEKFADAADVAINAALNGNNGELLQDVVRDGGRVASVGDQINFGAKSVKFEHIRPLGAAQDRRALMALSQLFDADKLQITIYKTLPLTLDGVISGHQLLETRHAPGRIVLLA